MRKRLELSKELMKDSAAIFISVDINELAQLKLLCDDIFGESNLVSLVSVKVKDPACVGLQSFVFDVIEYVLMYTKNVKFFRIAHQKVPEDYEQLICQDRNHDKIVLDFGQPKFVKEISRKNAGLIKIYQCENYSVEKTVKLSLKEYIKDRHKIFANYNPSGGMIIAIKEEIPRTGLSYIEYKPTKGRNAGKIAKTHFLNGRKIS